MLPVPCLRLRVGNLQRGVAATTQLDCGEDARSDGGIQGMPVLDELGTRLTEP